MPPLTPEQADFILDWLDADMEGAAATCETPDDNGETIYQRTGDADAKTFLSNLIDALTPLATPVEEAEGEEETEE